MNEKENKAQEIRDAVLKKAKYSQIEPGLVEETARKELEKGRSFKEAVKETAGKLHQAAAGYFPHQIDYSQLTEGMSRLPADLDAPETKRFCVRAMEAHSSTRERLSILETFFRETLAIIAPVRSILDLGCGMNPLALPWMPVSENITYYGCDIFQDLAGFLEKFRSHFNLHGGFSICNILELQFTKQAQVGFLLKTLTCLEQLEKDIAGRLLEAAPCDYLLVSYPVRSLSGRGKGMRKNYDEQFQELTAGKDWEVTRFEFTDELAFLVKK